MGPYYAGVPTGLIGKRQNKIKHEKEPASLPALLSKVSIVDLANYHYHLMICQLRSIFNAKIITLPESRIQSYWAQMRFSGRMTPPKEYGTLEAMLAYIANNKGAVGYIPAETELLDHLTVIYKSL